MLKRGTMIRGIRLTDNEDEIEGRTDKIKGLVQRTEFLKKVVSSEQHQLSPNHSDRVLSP